MPFNQQEKETMYIWFHLHDESDECKLEYARDNPVPLPGGLGGG